MIYNIINEQTNEIVAYTIVDNNLFDNDELTIDDIINIRIENAIDENLIDDDCYYYEKSNKKYVSLLI